MWGTSGRNHPYFKNTFQMCGWSNFFRPVTTCTYMPAVRIHYLEYKKKTLNIKHGQLNTVEGKHKEDFFNRIFLSCDDIYNAELQISYRSILLRCCTKNPQEIFL